MDFFENKKSYYIKKISIKILYSKTDITQYKDSINYFVNTLKQLLKYESSIPGYFELVKVIIKYNISFLDFDTIELLINNKYEDVQLYVLELYKNNLSLINSKLYFVSQMM